MIPMGGQWYFYSIRPYDSSEFQQANVFHHSLGVPSWLRVSQLASLIFPLWARRDGVDVFWGPRHQLPFFLPRHLRTAVTIHDLVWKRYGETMRFPGRQVEAVSMPRALQRADTVVAVSSFTRDELKTYFPLSSEKIVVVTGASHLVSSSAPAHSSVPPHDRYFLFVGTMEPRKNLLRLMRAYRLYRDEAESPLRLVIVGGHGWGGVDARQIREELSLGDHVTIGGTVSELDLEALYKNAHTLIMPSLYEGFGLPVIESLSQGVPVICSENSAMSEVAGAAGLFVDPKSELELCDALLQVSNGVVLHSLLKNQALKEAKRYDWDYSAKQMFSLLAKKSTDESPGS